MSTKVDEVDSLEGRVKIAENGASLMLETIPDRAWQLHAAEAAHNSAEVALWSTQC